MKTEDVRKLPPLRIFHYWIRERHQIYLKRKAGKPKPWTDDDVLQRFFFTNPYRENDKVTQWFRDNIREPLRDDPQVLLATIIFRWFNLPSTAEALMDGPIISDDCSGCLLLNWDENEALRRLEEVKARGEKVFTGAYMISSPPGSIKTESICSRITKIWNEREILIEELERGAYERKSSMQAAHELLTTFDGLGGFMSYEIVCDLRYTYLLEHAPDKMTWANPGPGAVRGMYRLLGLDFKKGDNHTILRKPKDWDEKMKWLLEVTQKALPQMPKFEMREIEHSLCEVDKYLRALEGDGKMKRNYKGY